MNTYCPLPWYGLELNEHNEKDVCCWIYDANVNYDQLRQDLSNGKQSKYCEACWTLERVGAVSRRQQHLKFVEKINKSNPNPQLVQLFLGRTCNAACTTCSSEFSSRWHSLNKKIVSVGVIQVPNLDWAGLIKLSLLGGEPFYMSHTWDILRRLQDHNNTQLELCFTTNGSIRLNDQQLETLGQFSNLHITVSIDGLDATFDYLRWPTKFINVVENIKQYQTVAKDVNVSYTVSSLNILDHKENVSWFKANNLNYSINEVDWPKVFNLFRAPREIKQQLALAKDVYMLSRSKITENEMEAKWLVEELDRQDQLKKTNWRTSLPKLRECLE